MWSRALSSGDSGSAGKLSEQALVSQHPEVFTPGIELIIAAFEGIRNDANARQPPYTGDVELMDKILKENPDVDSNTQHTHVHTL